MILVLAGPVHSGKTSLLRRLLPDLEALRLPVSGYLSLSVMNKGAITGYDLFDIKKGGSMPFLRTSGEAGWPKVGPYFFLPRGIEAAAAAILGHEPGEILIVDEVGPMELAGRGVWPALSEVLSRPSLDCLLVVRKPLLEDLRNRLGNTPLEVFDVERKDVHPSLIRALSELREGRSAPSDTSDSAMTKVKVKFFGPFRDLFAGRELEMDLPADVRLRELLRRLCDTPEREKQVFAAAEAIQPHVVIMKNGSPVHQPGGLETSLQDGDIVAIFPFLGGG